MTGEVLEIVDVRNKAWKIIRDLAITWEFPTSWETKIRQYYKARTAESQIDLPPKEISFAHVPDNAWERTIEEWGVWDTNRKKARVAISKARVSFKESIIKEIGQPDGDENIWKAIKRLVPPKSGNSSRSTNKHRTMMKENGEWCFDEKQEIDEV